MSIRIEIPELNKAVKQDTLKYIDTLTKPPGSLGKLEELAAEIAAMTAEPFPVVTPPGVLIFAGDHGIVEEGVSAFPQEVTAQMVQNFLTGGAAISVFSGQIGAKLEIVDVGVAAEIASHADLHVEKVGFGTRNFLKEDAMTRSEAETAITIGMNRAFAMIDHGVKCLIVGEMGIGNTTPSTAILASFSDAPIDEIVGAGTGLSNDAIAVKARVIAEAISKRQPDRHDPLDVLSKVGGFEIAAMVGAMLAAASRRVPVLVDGFISTVAALVATQLEPNSNDYMIVGHASAERGHETAVKMLNKTPLLQLGFRLGEGSGAAVAFPIVQAATLMLNEMATFKTAGIAEKTARKEEVR
ncbi:nicotinate-nucleotide--dimethylbenzimidazole phosphoribosyltransferase [Priestia koreensis]|uniref:nicotinate-nucleotide--dimethylbenzimidazole phosphoribosyltransferase n=1 Tax=Priestia koreensis TaxID=284581 RepID=UPI001F57F2B0|nr:nicotinate-nucleotide--dimethylbenzimidazole phosphoribosyltransferase [Priestia koreensis]UNL83809.1 nicotinate-nucleotide--dimethylbenzimidazole phosphoribosyltransferase [Priestia koreensis]